MRILLDFCAHAVCVCIQSTSSVQWEIISHGSQRVFFFYFIVTTILLLLLLVQFFSNVSQIQAIVYAMKIVLWTVNVNCVTVCLLMP